MPGDVGAVAGLLDTVASWLMSEDGYAEWQRRRELKQSKLTAVQRLHTARTKEDWAAVRDAVYELERMSARP